MCSFCWKNADRDQNFLFDLIYFQRSGVYTHWFSHMRLILILAYKRNRQNFIEKSEALLSWLVIRLLFWRFYIQLLVHQKPRLWIFQSLSHWFCRNLLSFLNNRCFRIYRYHSKKKSLNTSLVSILYVKLSVKSKFALLLYFFLK